LIPFVLTLAGCSSGSDELPSATAATSAAGAEAAKAKAPAERPTGKLRPSDRLD
jgi:hypothetical protein